VDSEAAVGVEHLREAARREDLVVAAVVVMLLLVQLMVVRVGTAGAVELL
jgi:hypothetical protein